jgi:hypothetical protein
VRAIGGSIGYSIYFNIFQENLAQRLPTLVAKYSIEAGLPLSGLKEFVILFLTAPLDAAMLPGVTGQVLAAATTGAQWAYAESLRYVWWTSLAIGCLSMECSMLIPNTRRFQTSRIADALSDVQPKIGHHTA